MKKFNAKYIVLPIVLVLALLFSGCSEAVEEPVGEELSYSKVLYVTPGTLGDQGFTDSVNSGIQKIGKEYGAEVRVIESAADSSKYAQNVEAAFAWGPDVLFVDAYGMEDLIKEYSEQYPDVIVINLDFVLENESDTITSVTFIQEEGSFMAGVAAALVTSSDLEYANEAKVVGAMGGQDIWVIRSFMHGYEQGVNYIDPEIEVISNFVGDFFDPVTGKSAAKQLFAQDADVVFQIAGLSGSGALEAAAEEEKYAIGVDSNQNGTYPGHIITSMVKDLGGAAFEMYKSIIEGTFEQGKVYEMHYGYAGTYLAIDQYTRDILPEEILSQIETIEEKLENGEIVVERYPNE
jgi:basic membrane protein A